MSAGRAYTTQELTFDPLPREFIAKTVGTDHIQRFVAKGLSKMDLMGELFPLTHFPTYQLALPLTREDGRRTTLAGMLTGTTFSRHWKLRSRYDITRFHISYSWTAPPPPLTKKRRSPRRFLLAFLPVF